MDPELSDESTDDYANTGQQKTAWLHDWTRVNEAGGLSTTKLKRI